MVFTELTRIGTNKRITEHIHAGDRTKIGIRIPPSWSKEYTLSCGWSGYADTEGIVPCRFTQESAEVLTVPVPAELIKDRNKDFQVFLYICGTDIAGSTTTLAKLTLSAKKRRR